MRIFTISMTTLCDKSTHAIGYPADSAVFMQGRERFSAPERLDFGHAL